jgi:hypothetical protein
MDVPVHRAFHRSRHSSDPFGWKHFEWRNWLNNWRSNQVSDADVIVIGAGHNGLAAAGLL